MNSFKIYLWDVGLLAAQGNLDARTLLEGDIVFTEFKGALTAQFVAQELAAEEIELYYYSAASSRGEIDFVNRRLQFEPPCPIIGSRSGCEMYALSFKRIFEVRCSHMDFRAQRWYAEPSWLMN